MIELYNNNNTIADATKRKMEIIYHFKYFGYELEVLAFIYKLVHVKCNIIMCLLTIRAFQK